MPARRAGDGSFIVYFLLAEPRGVTRTVQATPRGKAGRSNSETFAEDQDMIKCLV